MLTRLTLLLFGSVLSHSALAGWTLDYRLQQQSSSAGETAYFQTGDSTFRRAELLATAEHDGWFARWQGRREDDNGTARHRGRLLEGYRDWSRGDWDFSAGLKRIDWGVGFAWQPLDLFRPRDRRALTEDAAEGLPLLLAETFTEFGALSAVCSNDARYNNGLRSDDYGCGLRRFEQRGDWDLQALAYASRTHKLSLGASAVGVPDAAWRVHASIRYDHRYTRLENSLLDGDTLLATSDSLLERQHHGGWRGLLGAQYSTASGHSWLLEYWHDGSAYAAADWDALKRLSAAQQALADSGVAPPEAVAANLRASSRAFSADNLLRDNLLLRWSFDGARHDPAIDLLLTPEDGGAVLSLEMRSEIAQNLKLRYGWRGYGGRDGAALRQLPHRHTAYLELMGTW